ncbi:T9SS type A sorting domain-containing protein [Pontibacter burrus]|uniref:T9SS type A sorting domain-containing protein n=1 Tax=Pontibacter burrus TaxID=2704466 RepID=A0A6B3LYQ1_9BACT|nr:T9SS type A sorting domain-containing protein [Pontibacter burrus]NEM99466.1 T9SS type A sorting domain-containing protein [Pontibacter burrus]
MENELLQHPATGSQRKNILLLITGIISLLFLVNNAHAQTIRSARSGNWQDAGTWVGSVIPQSIHAVEINEGHQITITGQASSASINLYPPHNSSKGSDRSELIVAPGATLSTTTLALNPRNDRRYTSLTNNGGTIVAATFIIGSGCEVENIAGTIAVTGDITNDGDILTTNAMLEIAGNYNRGGKSTFTKGTGTVKYTGNVAPTQMIAPLAYHHLQLAGSSRKVTTTNLSVSGDLQIDSGARLTAGNYSHTVAGKLVNNGLLQSETTLPTAIVIGSDIVNNGTVTAGAATYTVGGNWTNNGTFQEGTSTVILQGNTLQQLYGTTTFYNMHYQGTGQAQLRHDVTIRNQTSVTNSHLNTGDHTLWLGNNAVITTLETDDAHIIGNVQTSRTLTLTAPENFGNIGITLTRNNVDPGSITVERITGVTTEISDGTESITRQYNISRSGTNDISALSMDMELAFLPKELKAKPLNSYSLYNKGRNSEAMPVQSTVVNQTTMRHTNSNRFGTYTLAPPVILPLPVELTIFKAQKRQHVVELQWQTASEKDNMGFEIQVSTDGKTYRVLDFIASKTGNSNITQFYSYTDKNPAHNATLHYRLKQLDFSGDYSYSQTRAVAPFIPSTIVQAVPNPFTDYIRFAGSNNPVQVTLTDMSGKPVLHKTLLPAQRTTDGYYHLDTTQVQAAGFYVLSVKTPDQIYQAKLLKQ